MSQMGTDLGFESRVVGKTLVDVGSAAGEVLAASKTAIERTAKIDGLTWFVNIGLCLLDFALGAVGKRFYSRVRDATILTFYAIRIRPASSGFEKLSIIWRSWRALLCGSFPSRVEVQSS
jgi:hypothetical protein